MVMMTVGLFQQVANFAFTITIIECAVDLIIIITADAECFILWAMAPQYQLPHALYYYFIDYLQDIFSCVFEYLILTC